MDGLDRRRWCPTYNEAMAGDGAHIRLKLDTDEPVSLTDFVGNFVGIANQFEKFVGRNYPDHKADSEIYVKEVRAGSIEADLIAFLGTSMGGGTLLAGAKMAVDAIDTAQILSGFVDNLKSRISPYFRQGGRTASATRSDLDDFLKTVRGIVRDTDGKMRLEAAEFEAGKRNVRSSFAFTAQEAREAERQIGEHKVELETQATADHQRVMMRFVRPSIEKVATHRRTGERAVIEAIHPKPLSVLYVSDLARERIQYELKEGEGNPFNLLFDADVNVEISNGRPVAFRIVAIHDVTDAPDEE